jgi:hypothetical protein
MIGGTDSVWQNRERDGRGENRKKQFSHEGTSVLIG